MIKVNQSNFQQDKSSKKANPQLEKENKNSRANKKKSTSRSSRVNRPNRANNTNAARSQNPKLKSTQVSRKSKINEDNDSTASNSRILTDEKRLEDSFIKKTRSKSQSQYFAVDMWNLKEEFCHPLIPLEKINDEPFKTVIINKEIKKSQNSAFKTDSCKAFTLLKNNKRQFGKFKKDSNSGNRIDFFQNYESKKRKVSSCKKIYESVLEFTDESKNSHFFKVYEDEAIGFDCRYSQILKEMEMDNDLETDEEQLELAHKHSIINLREAIQNFNKKSLRNRMRIKRNSSKNKKKSQKPSQEKREKGEDK